MTLEEKQTIEARLEELRTERAELNSRMQGLEKQIGELGIGKNALNFVKAIDFKARETRILLGREKQAVQMELNRIVTEIRKLSALFPRQNNYKDVLLEILSKDQIREAEREIKRRENGEPPLGLSFSLHDTDRQNKYKKLAKAYVTSLYDSRLALNEVIREGCSKYGNAEFLQLISPINRLLKPTQELDKEIRINHL